MDERIEAFLLDVLEDEGKDPNVVHQNARRYLATYVHIFRDQEIDQRKKDEAAQRCRDWCRERIHKFSLMLKHRRSPARKYANTNL